MFPPLPLEPAKTHALSLMKELDFEPKLFSPGGGLMFGVLVCKNPDTGEEVVLKAFSGQYFGTWLVEGWVPPLLDVASYEKQVLQDDGEIQELTKKIKVLEKNPDGLKELQELKKYRRSLTGKSLAAIYNLYRFPCADGVNKGFADFYPNFSQGKLPPTGTGDCCGPKLLGAAFDRGLVPISMAEFFYGNGGKSSCNHGQFYPPCDEKCGLVLPTMLGLEILYRDEDLVVVNKEAGLLSVPGRGPENQDSVVSRLQRLFPHCISQPSVHRIDQDTSGILVLALSQEAHRHLSRQFMDATVYKEYEALLRGRVVLEGWSHLELPFRLDVENRPRQIYDEVHGKLGITDWKVLSYHRCSPETCADRVLTRVLFVPRTGRTHQLRLHAMDKRGIGVPIQGDRLYVQRLAGERLMLHATKIVFIHPKKKVPMEFNSPAPF